jgi:mannose-6-phosphate isomerase-like protein (cupin superfamily)
MMPVVRKTGDRPEWLKWSGFGLGVIYDPSVVERHFHDADEYWFVFEGCARVMSEGQEYIIGPGDILVTKMGDEHEILEILDGPLRAFWVEDELRGRKRPGHLHRPADD